MIERIIIGIIIGFIGGFFLSKNSDTGINDTSSVTLIFTAIISIAFIASSFMYGAIFGLFAIGEIILGFVIASNMFNTEV